MPLAPVLAEADLSLPPAEETPVVLEESAVGGEDTTVTEPVVIEESTAGGEEVVTEPETTVVTQESIDSDGDGLTNTAEQVYQTDPAKSDTDGDGFSDATEILNGFSATTPTEEEQALLEELVSDESAVGGEVAVEETTPSTLDATPSLTTDKDDYMPGQIATIFGNFFQSLTNFVLKIFGSDENDGNYTETVVNVTSDESGSFSHQYQLDELYRPYYEVVATDTVGNIIAQTYFRDAAIGTYDQCSNDDGDGYGAPDTGCRWINGNLNGNNSTYQEGESTVQRLWIEGFAPGSTHTVTLQYGTTKQGKHAYDFLTTWSHSEGWIDEADRCQDITGCDIADASENTLAIPVDTNGSGEFQGTVGARNFVMRGASLTSATAPSLSGLYTGDSETSITISFTVAGSGSMCSTKGK